MRNLIKFNILRSYWLLSLNQFLLNFVQSLLTLLDPFKMIVSWFLNFAWNFINMDVFFSRSRCRFHQWHIAYISLRVQKRLVLKLWRSLVSHMRVKSSEHVRVCLLIEIWKLGHSKIREVWMVRKVMSERGIFKICLEEISFWSLSLWRNVPIIY